MLGESLHHLPGPPARPRSPRAVPWLPRVGHRWGEHAGCAGSPRCCCPTKRDGPERLRGVRGRCCWQNPQSGGVQAPGGSPPQPPQLGMQRPTLLRRGPFPVRGRGSAGGTDGLSPLSFCLWPTCGGGRIRARGWGVDVGQQETDGAEGLAPLPPPCLRQPGLGTDPPPCPATLAAFPTHLLPPVRQAAGSAAPPAPAPRAPQRQQQGWTPGPVCVPRGREHPARRDPGHPVPPAWGQPCWGPGAPWVTFPRAAGVCRGGGARAASSPYPNL